MQAPDELARLVETSLEELTLQPALGELQEPIRYALGGGGNLTDRSNPLQVSNDGEPGDPPSGSASPPRRTTDVVP